ncbi:MAG: HAMP domain-containing sensor histidine kinase [Flavobacteriales bacterium]
MKVRSSALLLLYVLLGYVVVQFAWWGYLIYNLHVELFELSPESGIANHEDLIEKKLWMVMGEGAVFMILLLSGAYYIRKFLKREQRLARQERNFLLATTHELNSPIAGIKLNLQTLRRPEIDKEKAMTLVQSGLASLQRLEGLVSNILMASRLDAGKLSLSQANVNVSEIVSIILRQYETLIQSSRCEVEVDVAESHVIVGDQQAMEIIIGNLVSNATKYAAGAKLQIGSVIGDDYITLTVCDTGSGVEKGEVKEIFKKFYRAENEETRTQKGTGLGLYIVQQLVELQGGALFSRSNEPKGLCVEMKFLKAL